MTRKKKKEKERYEVMVTNRPSLGLSFFFIFRGPSLLAIKRDDHSLGCRMESVMRGAKIQLPLTRSSSSSRGKEGYGRTHSIQTNQST